MLHHQGADIVIAVAVDLADPSFNQGPPKKLIASLLHTIDIMSENLAQNELELADVIIRPVAQINGYSWKNSKEFRMVGEEETRKLIPEIKKAISTFYSQRKNIQVN